MSAVLMVDWLLSCCFVGFGFLEVLVGFVYSCSLVVFGDLLFLDCFKGFGYFGFCFG